MTGVQTLDEDIRIPESTSEASKGAADRLLLAFMHRIDEMGYRVQGRALLSGLGLDGDPVDLSVLAEMGGRLGLSVRTSAFKPRRGVPDLPAILQLGEERALIVYGLDSGGMDVFDPVTMERRIADPGELIGGTPATWVEVRVDDDVQSTERTDVARRRGAWFWSTLKAARGPYLKVVIASFIVNTLAVAAPLFSLNVYDRVLPNSSFSTLWVLAIGMALVLVFDLTFRALRGVVVDAAGRWADVRLASVIYDHVLRMDLADSPARSGEFANRLREFETVREFFSSATVISLLDLIFVSLFLYVIYLVGGPMVFIPMAAVVVVLLLGIIVQPIMLKSVRDVQEEAALKHGLLIETINSLPTIKSLNAEDHFLRRWQTYVARTARSTEKVRFVSQNLMNATLSVQLAVTVGLIVYGAYLFDAGLLSMGGIIATVMLASRAIAPLASIAGTLSRLQQSLVSLGNLNDIMVGRMENETADLGVSRSIGTGDILLDNVGYTYPESEVAALEDISLRIPAGMRLGIIGKVGAGKSTLVGLLAGLHRPGAGTVRIDGINIEQIHTRDLRDGLGHVGQDVSLFAGTLRDNLVMGMPHVSDAAIVEAAKITGAAEFIDAHPKGYGMEIGERGRRLSGGQRQLVALTRTLLREPAIIVLDEPTSAMDVGSETVFLDRLEKAVGARTLIVSTHRHSVLRIVDHLLVLDRGKLAAFGPKDDVLHLLSRRSQQKNGSEDGKVVPLATATAKAGPV